MSTVMAAMPARREVVLCLCHSCCPERMNVSAVPTAPRVFFQPLSSRLAYPEFNEHYEQQYS